MMEGRKGVLLGVVLAGVAIAVALSVPVLRTTSTTFNFLFSQEDLYEPLATTGVELETVGSVLLLDFELKYPGLHWIAINVEKPQPGATAYEGEFVLSLEVRREAEVLLSEEISGPGDPYWGHQSGFSVKWFRAPNDFPLGIPLQLRLEVVKPDTAFSAKYGRAQLVVRKLSDE